MTISDPRIRSLVRQANKVEASGKRVAAEELYRQILAEAPDTAVAWAGLGNVITDPNEKEAAYERALELEPDNRVAQIGLAEMRGETIPEEWLEEPEPEPELEPELVVEAEDAHEYALYCYRHPDRSTSLRCYNCHNPICINCTNKTSVGYLCPECIRDLEDKFFNAKATDYLLATLVSLPLSLIAGFLVWQLGRGFFFILIMIFAGGAVGSLIGRLTKRAIGGRRGRYLPELVVGMMILGVILPVLPAILAFGPGAFFSGVGIMSLITPGIYLFVASGSAYYWMK